MSLVTGTENVSLRCLLGYFTDICAGDNRVNFHKNQLLQYFTGFNNVSVWE